MKLREYMFYASLTVEQFARELGISKSHLSNILVGKGVPSMKTANLIYYATSRLVTINELIHPEEHTSESERLVKEAEERRKILKEEEALHEV